ncbi:MAG TPA: hypothetical protein VIG99_22005 [Myxococcaceae bacterium]|jgi:hypothetical protein
MLKPTPQALAAAVTALYRIRAIEDPPGPDGNKTVWHQCALGAELVSTVNERHVIRQELTLIQSYFTWTPTSGLSSGVVVDDGPKALANGGPLVEMDAALDKERLAEALAALAHYSGEDLYIRHLLRVMTLVRDGLAEDDEDSVTGVKGLGDAGRGRWSRRWFYAAAALAALGAAVAVMLHL